MADMICSLLHLPDIAPLVAELRAGGIAIRRPNPWEQSKARRFVLEHFSEGWADELATSFSRQPVSSFVAMQGDAIVGFACYECSRRGYFGPTGVVPALRGRGLGKALFVAALMGLQDMGYTYAIIGDAGPTEFYAKCVGAVAIPIGDGRGVYTMKEDPKFAAKP